MMMRFDKAKKAGMTKTDSPTSILHEFIPAGEAGTWRFESEKKLGHMSHPADIQQENLGVFWLVWPEGKPWYCYSRSKYKYTSHCDDQNCLSAALNVGHMGTYWKVKDTESPTANRLWAKNLIRHGYLLTRYNRRIYTDLNGSWMTGCEAPTEVLLALSMLPDKITAASSRVLISCFWSDATQPLCL